MKYPTITKHNLDAWESITYSYIIGGMVERNNTKRLVGDEKRLEYGEIMTMANDLTVRLFRALKRDMRVKELAKK